MTRTEGTWTTRLGPLLAGSLCMASGLPSAFAHGGAPTVAWVSNPVGAGETADTSYEIRWIDSDLVVPTSTTTVNLYYTPTNPRTFVPGEMPPDVVGTPIVLGIPESDRTNRYLWNTSSVAAGSYWIWSFIEEVPQIPGDIQIVHFSPGVLTIAHPGDPVPPAVVITDPDTAYRWADLSYTIRYQAFDPHGTGLVRLEAELVQDPSSRRTLAEDLPAVRDGRFEWATEGVPEGDWVLRAHLVDDRGFSFSSYGRFYLLVSHATATVDAGSADAEEPRPDSGLRSKAPAWTLPPGPPGGCVCSHANRAGSVEGVEPASPMPGLLVGFALFFSIRRGRRP